MTETGKEIISEFPVNVSSDNGTFAASFVLPKDKEAYLGTYNLVLLFASRQYSTEFAVDAYKKPPFLVTVTTGKRAYTGKEQIAVTVNARYYIGRPVAKEPVHVRVFRSKKYTFSPVGSIPFFEEAKDYLGLSESNSPKDLVMEPNSKLDSDGNFTFSIKPDKIDDDYTYSVMATVDAASSAISGATSFSLNRSSFYLVIKQNNTVYAPGDTAEFTVQAALFDKTVSAQKREAFMIGRAVRVSLIYPFV